MVKRTWMLLSLACVLATGCATQGVDPAPPIALEQQCPRPATPPADVMVKREPTFLQRLQTFFSGSPVKPTP